MHYDCIRRTIKWAGYILLSLLLFSQQAIAATPQIDDVRLVARDNGETLWLTYRILQNSTNNAILEVLFDVPNIVGTSTCSSGKQPVYSGIDDEYGYGAYKDWAGARFLCNGDREYWGGFIISASASTTPRYEEQQVTHLTRFYYDREEEATSTANNAVNIFYNWFSEKSRAIPLVFKVVERYDTTGEGDYVIYWDNQNYLIDFTAAPYLPIPTSTATSAAWVLTCEQSDSLFVGSICGVLAFLFIPNPQTLSQFADTMNELKTKAPLGYYTAIKDVLSTISTSTPAYQLIDLSALNSNFFDNIKIGIIILLWFFFAMWLFNRLRHFQI